MRMRYVHFLTNSPYSRTHNTLYINRRPLTHKHHHPPKVFPSSIPTFIVYYTYRNNIIIIIIIITIKIKCVLVTLLNVMFSSLLSFFILCGKDVGAAECVYEYGKNTGWVDKLALDNIACFQNIVMICNIFVWLVIYVHVLQCDTVFLLQ